MPQKFIITTTDPKMTILDKARKSGFGMNLSCPDGLASTEKGVRVVWYGSVDNDEAGEINQLLLSLAGSRINDLEKNTPLRRFLNSLENVGLLDINKR